MLSVIIPTLNAAHFLAACLDALGAAEEIVVADGGSDDETVSIAERVGTRVIVAPKGRGSQLRAGAEAARGDWLLFLHADTRLASGWDEAAQDHMARSASAACFRFRLDAAAWQARLIERGVAVRAGVLKLPYGDQGLLISRALYDEVGGYSAVPIMEDVDLVRRIGRRRLVVLPVDAITSSERWRSDGWLSRSACNLMCLGAYGLGVPPDRIARLYR
jgi:rSAM/selenodomain-associated transferase 2